MARLPRGILPTLSLAGLAFAAWSVLSVKRVEPGPPPVAPPRAPFEVTVSGNGVLEPAGARTTGIGVPFAGLVTEVFVDVGDRVVKGAMLFRLDDRALVAQRAPLEADVRTLETAVRVKEQEAAAKEAMVAWAEAGKAVAEAKVDRLAALPRAEELPPLVARVEEVRAAYDDLRAQVERLAAARAKASGVVPDDDFARRQAQADVARRALERAQADLALARAGAWAPDVAEAKAAVAQAASQVAQVRADLARARAEVERAQGDVERAKASLAQNAVERERTIVRAPIDATVLDANVRAGEYATAGRDALLVLGDTATLLVRVDVDEESAPRVRAGAKAKAVVRGFPDAPFDLEFVRIEPYLRPKRSLTGATSERVDTRVLQVIFRAGKSSLPLYVGQQVDVFMEGRSRADTAAGKNLPTSGGPDAPPGTGDVPGMDGPR